MSFLFSQNGQAQEQQDSLVFDHSIFPLAFFLPETSLGLGGTGILTFRNSGEDDSNRPSQIIYSAVYTLKNQFLFFVPYEIYAQSNTHRFVGELGYYRYFYNYYGTGSTSRAADVESYSVNFPRFDFSYAYTKNKIWYYGAGFKYDGFDIVEREDQGLLDTEQPIGYTGGTKLNLQFLIVRDKRDNIISSTQGSYFEIKVEKSLPEFITPFDYHKASIDYRYFIPLKEKLTLALKAASFHTSANTPFFDYEYISSPKRSRGFNDRRYMARNISTIETEFRFPIYKRLSGVAFGSANHIYNDGPFDFSDNILKFGFGTGLRFLLDEKEGTRIRLDLASGDGAFNIYVTMNEAF